MQLKSGPWGWGSRRFKGTAHLARPWMPKALRDRHCARSFSTVASTASMLGQAVWATGWGRVPGRTPTRPTRLRSGAKSLPCPATCSPGLTILESRQPLLWLLPALPSVGSVSCLAGLLLRDGGSGDWEGPQP